MTLTQISRPQGKLWLAAIKPPMYSVAIMPIWVGSAVAFREIKIFNITIFSLFIAAAILILAWENILVMMSLMPKQELIKIKIIHW